MEYPQGFADSHWRKRGICGVLAVALCAEVSFEVAHATCKRAMHDLKLGTRFRGGTYHKQRKHALSLLAVKFIEHESMKGLTFRQFIQNYAKPDTHYIVCNRGHVVTIYNGIVADQSSIAPSYVHKHGGRQIITKPVIEITGKGW